MTFKNIKTALFAATLGAGLATSAVAQDSVTVASKIDTEGELLGNMIRVLLEDAGLEVENRIQLGPTNVVREAITAGEVDIYPEYTGNGAFFFGMEDSDVWNNADEAYEKVSELDLEENGIVWLQPAPANNTWAIAVRKDVAEAEGLATMEDFGRWVSDGGEVKLAASAEFVTTPNALPAFQETYGFELDGDQVLELSGGNTATTIRAAAEGMNDANAAMAYGTDGALAAVGLVVMEDTKGVQFVYEPAPIVRQEVLDAHPEIEDILNPVFETLTLETLQGLNSKIAVDGLDAQQVAQDYLEDNDFLN